MVPRFDVDLAVTCFRYLMLDGKEIDGRMDEGHAFQ